MSTGRFFLPAALRPNRSTMNDPADVLVRDVSLVLYVLVNYYENKRGWPSVYALAKIISNLALSQMLDRDIFGYPTGFEWIPSRFGGYVVYNSFLFKKCSFLRFLDLADCVARKMGLSIKVITDTNPKRKKRIVVVGSIEDGISAS